MNTEFDQNWARLSEEVLSGMKEWRLQHPKATFAEIERAVDERLGGLRARMIKDAALASAKTDLTLSPKEERPVCEKCLVPLVSNGRRKRSLSTKQNQTIELERNYALCPKCRRGIFPPR